MKANKQKYPLDQCALYKCRSRKKLESILAIEQGDLRNIQSAIKYSSFEIDKKDSSEKRTITAPKRTIKAVQARILTLIQHIERPEWLISGEKGKCYVDNGKAHIGSAYVLTMDIKNSTIIVGVNMSIASFWTRCKQPRMLLRSLQTLLRIKAEYLQGARQAN